MNQLRGRVIDVATEVVLFQKFLEVVRHPNKIEFNNSIHAVNSSGMNVSVDHIVSVQVFDSLTQLSKDMQNLFVGKLLFAESLPLMHVLGRLQIEEEFPLRHSVLFEDLNQIGVS